jgi:hypothetical protein
VKFVLTGSAVGGCKKFGRRLSIRVNSFVVDSASDEIVSALTQYG